jgi:hypothetical protein
LQTAGYGLFTAFYTYAVRVTHALSGTTYLVMLGVRWHAAFDSHLR